MTDPATLLPPAASPLERAVEATTDRLFGLTDPVGDLWNPAECPLPLLPWLAWALSIDSWDSGWSEARKRLEVARAIELQRRKGTPASVEAVLASFDSLLELVEWFEVNPAAEPHTFEVRLPLDAAGGTRATAVFAAAIVREVSRVKPVRSHFQLVQQLRAASLINTIGAAQATGFVRMSGPAITSAENFGLTLLTQDGEPVEDGAGGFLEIA